MIGANFCPICGHRLIAYDDYMASVYDPDIAEGGNDDAIICECECSNPDCGLLYEIKDASVNEVECRPCFIATMDVFKPSE